MQKEAVSEVQAHLALAQLGQRTRLIQCATQSPSRTVGLLSGLVIAAAISGVSLTGNVPLAFTFSGLLILSFILAHFDRVDRRIDALVTLMGVGDKWKSEAAPTNPSRDD
ncbi:MAG: hypothetical protein O7H41_00030 [Planctomycetota bacterium]|nr:hypothetical protein [Planctomycetota bacterium]